MNLKAAGRPYRQQARATAAEDRTERILTAALDLFLELPYEQVTLAAVADRAEVGLQTLIRRFRTKDGLVEAVNGWVVPAITAHRGPPRRLTPEDMAETVCSHYERWGALTERTIKQEDSSPALKAGAEGGRRAHRDWVAACYADVLEPLPEVDARGVLARLVTVTGVEAWLVLSRDCGLPPAEVRSSVAHLVVGAVPFDTAHRYTAHHNSAHHNSGPRISPEEHP
jgi:AcrR family transcriptional regulator